MEISKLQILMKVKAVKMMDAKSKIFYVDFDLDIKLSYSCILFVMVKMVYENFH